MKKDAYYFPHDSNAKDDPKCVMLIEQLGLEGYGIYWVLIETLRDQPEYKYPLALIPAIARRYNSTQEKVKTVVQNYGLFSVKDDMFFYSESLIERMIPLQNQREKASLAGKASAEKRKLLKESTTSAQRSLDVSTTSVQPVEYSKVEYSKVKENKIKQVNIVSIETRKKDFYDLVSAHKYSYSKEMLRGFFDYWTEPSKSGLKMRFEAEKFFDTKRRLTTWDNNNKEKFASKQDLSTKKGINGSDGTVSLLMSARVK